MTVDLWYSYIITRGQSSPTMPSFNSLNMEMHAYPHMIDFCLNKGSRARVSIRTKCENARMKLIVLHGVLVCFCQLYKYWCPLIERPQLRNCCHGVGGAVGTSVETFFWLLTVVVWMRTASVGWNFWIFCPQFATYWRKTRRVGIVGNVSLWAGFEVSKIHAVPSLPLSASCLWIKMWALRCFSHHGL